jgi:hypothetical protein
VKEDEKGENADKDGRRAEVALNYQKQERDAGDDPRWRQQGEGRKAQAGAVCEVGGQVNKEEEFERF